MMTHPRTSRFAIDPHPTIAHPHTYITRNTGGFFKETYRSGAAAGASKGLTDEGGAVMDTDREPAKRNVLTSIFYMSVEKGGGMDGRLCSYACGDSTGSIERMVELNNRPTDAGPNHPPTYTYIHARAGSRRRRPSGSGT